jgi:hypothetical protein
MESMVISLFPLDNYSLEYSPMRLAKLIVAAICGNITHSSYVGGMRYLDPVSRILHRKSSSSRRSSEAEVEEEYSGEDDGLNRSFAKDANEELAWFEMENEETFGSFPDHGAHVDDYEDEEEAEGDIEMILEANGLWDSHTDLPQGSIFHDGKHLLLTDYIDEGGNGIILSAKDKDGKEYAMKFAKATDEVGADSIEKEFEILTQLQSEGGIVRVYGSLGELSDHLGNSLRYMVLEKLGETYASIIEDSSGPRRYTPEARIKFVAGFAYYAILTLQKIHERHGVGHCDIHGASFMSASDGSFRLIDFGKARPVDQFGERGAINQDGEWVAVDIVSLLSPNELNNEVCLPRDDLIRLGAMLMSQWPSNLCKIGERKFHKSVDAIRGDSETVPPELLEKWINWKNGLSFMNIFDLKCDTEEDVNFPPGTYRGESFLEIFYKRVLSLGPADDVPYEHLLSLFVEEEGLRKIGLLSPMEAKAIQQKYAIPSL